METKQPVINDARLEITNVRVFDAPRHVVFEAWRNPAILKHWWGPNGFTNTFHDFSFEPGAEWSYTMHAPDGSDFPNKNIFTEIIENERIVLSHVSGHTFRVIADFEENEGRTKLSFHMKFDDEADFHQIKEFVAQANEQNLNRLEVQVARLLLKETPLLTRMVNAPRELVFDAFTQATHLAKWWGPVDFDIEIKEMQARVNSFFHFRMKNAEGFEMWGKFEYFQIDKPDQLVLVSSFADEEGNIIAPPFPEPWPPYILNCWTFSAKGDQTLISLQSAPFKASVIERETFIRNIPSMEQGYGGTLDKLDTYLSNI